MSDSIFYSFCKKLELEKERICKINDIKYEVTNCISKYYNDAVKKDSKFIGSYGRNTAVYVENIRLMVVLPSDVYLRISVNINEILNNIQVALREVFPSCEKSDNGNGLNVNIDGNLSFEIVPGFKFDEEVYIYLVKNEWKQLNLGLEKKLFKKMNEESNNNLINLCRVLKVWKQQQEIGISNILIDTFAYHFFDLATKKIYDFENYDEMIVDFFDFLLVNCKNDNFISIDGKTILRRNEEIYDKVKFSKQLAIFALNSSKYGLQEEAMVDWKKVLGNWYFI